MFEYLILGFSHICDINGYDHIVFIIAMCAIYHFYDWKKIFRLVTAFTIGHSISLLLAVLGYVSLNRSIIELLIPITILLTCIHNIYIVKYKSTTWSWRSYAVMLFFGLIHGMGFSNFFIAIFSEGMDVVLPLFSFNIGLEIGQLIVVLIVVGLNYILSLLNGYTHSDWVMMFSGLGIGLAGMMIAERIILIKI